VVTSFEVKLGQQDAYIDNISYTSDSVLPSSWDDDFSFDTIDNYDITPTVVIGGTGQFNYNSDWQYAELLTGDNIGLMFSGTVAGLDSGNFSIEFHPLAKYTSGGIFYLRLKENDSNFYEIYQTDGFGPGVIKKVINDQEVEIATLQNEYSQDISYHILINFSPAYTKIIAFGEVFTFQTDINAISVNRFEIELIDQDGYFDNIRYDESLDDYYVAIGDSITRASIHDDILSDGIGFQPILANLLLELKEYPHTVVNEGVSGHTSVDGLSLLPALLVAHPQARFFLVQYGTNDAWIPVPSGKGLSPGHPDYPGTFKDNMQQIIDLIKDNGKIPFLAKVPIAFEPRSYINPDLQDYNLVVDELVSENKIGVIPPDFYCFFENHPEQMDDDIHPNGLGYDSMANIWRDVLTDQYGGCL
jgi:lysophospholipase L1-like esterase